jgi:hypothetical protein
MNEELRSVAAELAAGNMSPELRARFIAVRAELFNRGIYDPVLVRFDSATVAQIDGREAGEQLAKWA